MNGARRKSSIKRTVPDENEPRVTSGNRLTKRISFSGKKAVRVFSGTESVEVWNNSYEISDARSDEQSSDTMKSRVSTLFPENKENSSLCTTSEFVNRSAPLNDFQVNNSVDVTLLDCEKRWLLTRDMSVKGIITDTSKSKAEGTNLTQHQRKTVLMNLTIPTKHAGNLEATEHSPLMSGDNKKFQNTPSNKTVDIFDEVEMDLSVSFKQDAGSHLKVDRNLETNQTIVPTSHSLQRLESTGRIQSKEGSDNSKRLPPKVVKKIFTPLIKEPLHLADVQSNVIEYQNHPEDIFGEQNPKKPNDAVSEMPEVDAKMDDNCFNLSQYSLNGSNLNVTSFLHSSQELEIGSNRKNKFLKLNDYIDQGKIRVFPETPVSDWKGKEVRLFSNSKNQMRSGINVTDAAQDRKKLRGTLNFDAEMSLGDNKLETTSNNANQTVALCRNTITHKLKTTLGVEEDIQVSPVQALSLNRDKEKPQQVFSFDDNTSFLTTAKWDDESITEYSNGLHVGCNITKKHHNAKKNATDTRKTVVMESKMIIDNPPNPQLSSHTQASQAFQSKTECRTGSESNSNRRTILFHQADISQDLTQVQDKTLGLNPEVRSSEHKRTTMFERDNNLVEHTTISEKHQTQHPERDLNNKPEKKTSNARKTVYEEDNMLMDSFQGFSTHPQSSQISHNTKMEGVFSSKLNLKPITSRRTVVFEEADMSLECPMNEGELSEDPDNGLKNKQELFGPSLTENSRTNLERRQKNADVYSEVKSAETKTAKTRQTVFDEGDMLMDNLHTTLSTESNRPQISQNKKVEGLLSSKLNLKPITSRRTVVFEEADMSLECTMNDGELSEDPDDCLKNKPELFHPSVVQNPTTHLERRQKNVDVYSEVKNAETKTAKTRQTVFDEGDMLMDNLHTTLSTESNRPQKSQNKKVEGLLSPKLNLKPITSRRTVVFEEADMLLECPMNDGELSADKDNSLENKQELFGLSLVENSRTNLERRQKNAHLHSEVKNAETKPVKPRQTVFEEGDMLMDSLHNSLSIEPQISQNKKSEEGLSPKLHLKSITSRRTVVYEEADMSFECPINDGEVSEAQDIYSQNKSELLGRCLVDNSRTNLERRQKNAHAYSETKNVETKPAKTRQTVLEEGDMLMNNLHSTLSTQPQFSQVIPTKTSKSFVSPQTALKSIDSRRTIVFEEADISLECPTNNHELNATVEPDVRHTGDKRTIIFKDLAEKVSGGQNREEHLQNNSSRNPEKKTTNVRQTVFEQGDILMNSPLSSLRSSKSQYSQIFHHEELGGVSNAQLKSIKNRRATVFEEADMSLGSPTNDEGEDENTDVLPLKNPSTLNQRSLGTLKDMHSFSKHTPKSDQRKRDYLLRQEINGTPHQSLIEFMEYEKSTLYTPASKLHSAKKGRDPIVDLTLANRKQLGFSGKSIYEVTGIDESGLNIIDEGDDASVIAAPVNTNKRSTANLTPILHFSKKRQTSVIGDSTADELCVDAYNATHHINSNNTQIRSDPLPDFITEKNDTLSGSVPIKTSDGANLTEEHLHSNCGNRKESESVKNKRDLQLTPIPKHMSRIPIFSAAVQKSLELSGTFNQSELHRSLDTIQVPRCCLASATKVPVQTQQRKVPDVTPDKFDEHITISDVSTYFMQARKNENAAEEDESCVNVIGDETITPETTNESFGQKLQNPTALDGPRAAFQKLYLDLTEQSPLLEDTHLNLVGSQLEESTTINIEHNDEVSIPDVPSPKPEKSKNVSVCPRCKVCQQSFVNETMNQTSFVMPPMPSVAPLMERLQRAQKLLTIDDAFEANRRKSLEQAFDVMNLSLDDMTLNTTAEEEAEDVYPFLENFRKETERINKGLEEFAITEAKKRRAPFVQRLTNLLSENGKNWIFNHTMRARRMFEFYHTRIMTIVIVVSYNDVENGKDIEITDVKLSSHRLPKKNWLPIQQLLDFQVKLELPHNLKMLCQGNDEYGVCEMLQQIDQICLQVFQFSRHFWATIIIGGAQLKKDEYRTFIKKILRERVTDESGHLFVRKTEFVIQVTNMKTVCFNDIIEPRLFHFDENIQFLPTGLDFLKVFLKNPKQFLK